MTDYKNLKLIASSSPHIRSNESTRTIMMDVIIAMIPALIMSVFVFGFRALALTLVSVAACVFWEWGYRKLLKKPQSIGDLSAVVTGMLLAFVCPPTLPYWMIIIGAFFAIVVVKQLFGGIGCNFMNPALVGRAVLLASYATAMTTWAVPMSKLSVFGSNADAVRSHFQVKKVSSSHTKGQTVIQSQEPLDREQLVRVINDTGYQAGEVVSRPLEKRGLLGHLKK